MWTSTIIVVLACLSLQASALDVVNLTDADFDTIVDGSTNVLVEFFAPWCGHCKTLAPEWKAAAETFDKNDKIILAAVDATVSPDLAKRFKVTGYPTIKYFPAGSTTAKDYSGGRTHETIVDWANKNVGLNKKIKVAPTFTTVLTADNFDGHVLGKKAALVEFYAPWCGHCKELTPKYEKLAQIFSGDKNILIGKVDATQHESLAQRFDVSGYPTIKYFPAGSAEAENYEDSREIVDFVAFLNKKAGTERSADGNLLPTAGRISELDYFIASVKVFDADFINAFTEMVGALDTIHASASELYLSTASKILAKGSDYAEKEIKRLSSMIANPSVVPVSKTGFQLRQNVLRAFLKE